MCSRARLGPTLAQAERKVDTPPPQTHIPLGQCCYLSFKGYSKQIKGRKNADIVCLREANCKQLCYGSAAFYLDADSEDPSAGALHRLWVHMAVLRHNQLNPKFFCRLEAGSRRKINQESCRGGYLHFCCLTFLPAYLFLLSLRM